MKLKKLFIASMVSILAVSNVCASTAKPMKFGTTTATVTTVVRNNRTLVPLREVSEQLGLTVDYDQTKKAITLTRGSQVVILKLDQSVITVNGLMYKMDTTPVVINNGTYLPLRVIAEAFGHTVTSANGIVSVSSIQEAENTLATKSVPAFTISLSKEDLAFQTTINGIIQAWNPYFSEIEKEWLRLWCEELYLFADYEKVLNTYSLNGFKLTSAISTEISRIDRALTVNDKVRSDLYRKHTDLALLRSLSEAESNIGLAYIRLNDSIYYAQKQPLAKPYREGLEEDYNKAVEYHKKAMESMVATLKSYQN